MRRQSELIETGITQKKTKKHKSKHGTASGEPPFGEEDKMAKICSKKMPRKYVLEYYRERIAQLTAENF